MQPYRQNPEDQELNWAPTCGCMWLLKTTQRIYRMPTVSIQYRKGGCLSRRYSQGPAFLFANVWQRVYSHLLLHIVLYW